MAERLPTGRATAVDAPRAAAHWPAEVCANVAVALTVRPALPRLCAALAAAALTAVAILLPAALLSGFARRSNRARRRALPRAVKLRVLVGTFFVPGLLEEIVFRAALLPRLHGEYADLDGQVLLLEPSADWGLALRSGLALAAFVAMHPVNAMLLRKEARPTFCDWRFLAAAAVLGAVCSVLYLETGTVWAPAVLHWLVVAVWLWEFDGLVSFARLARERDFRVMPVVIARRGHSSLGRSAHRVTPRHTGTATACGHKGALTTGAVGRDPWAMGMPTQPRQYLVPDQLSDAVKSSGIRRAAFWAQVTAHCTLEAQ